MCRKCASKQLSKYMRGKKRPNWVREILKKSMKGRIPWNKGKKCPQLSGARNPSWKGGVVPLWQRIRSLQEYSDWRTQIFERDNYTCQDCGQYSGYLEVHHHKKQFAQILQEFLQEYTQFSPIDDKETLIRLAINYKPFWKLSNGQTLCKKCHIKTRRKKCSRST